MSDASDIEEQEEETVTPKDPKNPTTATVTKPSEEHDNLQRKIPKNAQGSTKIRNKKFSPGAKMLTLILSD
jgi:hypothetical protein